MQLRLYKFNKKHIRKDGTVTIGPNRQWKWVKGETKQRKYRRRGQGMDLWSKRFGYLDSYTSKERKLLVCPSGYTFGQGMHALHRLWFAYKISKSEANIDKMEHYARAIQEVQEDIGLKTTSFPHLGIYGDKLILYEYSSRGRKMAVEVDHCHLKEKPQFEEEKKKLEENISTLAMPLEPYEEKGEELITIADEIPFHLKEKAQFEEEKKKLEENISTLAMPLEPMKKKEKSLSQLQMKFPSLRQSYLSPMKKKEKSLSQLQMKFPSIPGIEKDTQTGCIMRKVERKNGTVRTAKRL